MGTTMSYGLGVWILTLCDGRQLLSSVGITGFMPFWTKEFKPRDYWGIISRYREVKIDGSPQPQQAPLLGMDAFGFLLKREDKESNNLLETLSKTSTREDCVSVQPTTP